MMMKRIIHGLFGVAFAWSASWSTDALAEKRVALVIGNGTYKNVPALPNPPRDATAISGLLRNLGFSVTMGTNLTRDGFADRLRQFAEDAQGADVALFFYAGHGMSMEGKNYLLPIDANLKSELDVKLGGLPDVEVMLQQTMSDAKVKLVLLDACRDNPFVSQITRSARTRSVAVASGMSEMKSGEGTLLAFATGPGQVALDGEGQNSPFTKALMDNLAAPGLEIRLALTRVRAQVADTTQRKQLPWENTNLTGFFYMNPSAAGPAQVAAVDASTPVSGAPSGVNSSEMEVEFWRSVRNTNKPEELNAYLTRYPNGAFSSIARSRLAELTSAKENPSSSRSTTYEPAPDLTTAESSKGTESELNLDLGERRTVQRRLSALGFATPTDGRFNDRTRRAITNWQKTRSYPVSGFLNKQQYAALRAEEMPKTAEIDAPEELATATRSTRKQQQQPQQQRATNHNSGNRSNSGVSAPDAGAFIGGVVGGMMRRR